MPREPKAAHTLRLILGDQLHSGHSWFQRLDPGVLYVLFEMRQETDYAVHHVQKVLVFFAAMRRFADTLRGRGHRVLYVTLDDPRNTQDLPGNLRLALRASGAARLGYQQPDEFRLNGRCDRSRA